MKRAVKKLSVLGEGFQLIEMEERTMVRQQTQDGPSIGMSVTRLTSRSLDMLVLLCRL